MKTVPKRMPALRKNYGWSHGYGHSGRQPFSCGVCRRDVLKYDTDAEKCGMCIHGYAPSEIAENNFSPRRGRIRP